MNREVIEDIIGDYFQKRYRVIKTPEINVQKIYDGAIIELHFGNKYASEPNYYVSVGRLGSKYLDKDNIEKFIEDMVIKGINECSIK